MKTIWKFYSIGILILLLCSCATTAQSSGEESEFQLPPEVAMNGDAGKNWLFVTLHLEDGEELPFFIDTAAAFVYLDQSLMAKLGAPLASEAPSPTGGGAKRYPAPKLFLGDVPLKTGDTVRVYDFTKESAQAGRRIMGVLGIDCLKHYCIQLDFAAGKIRFLDPKHLETASLGQAFPLSYSQQWHQPLLESCNLVEGKGKPTLIDSGYLADGTLRPEQFAAAIHDAAVVPIKDEPGRALLHNCLWKGEAHTNLIIAKADWNAIGLAFLARHLVTLDFPERKIYMKQISIDPFTREDLEAGIKFLKDLNKKGQLPGWTTGDQGQLAYLVPHSNPLTIAIKKANDSSTDHYSIARASKDSPWKLQKAWQTDQNDNIIHEFPVP